MTLIKSHITLHGRRLEIETYEHGVIARAWAAGRWYEFPLLNYIRDLKMNGVVVDAGANVGNHSLWFALACGMLVHAFEPLHYDILGRNVHRNKAEDRIIVHPFALGAKTTAAEHLGKGALKPGVGPIMVRTLDSFNLPTISMIKADVEFMEPDVLRGGEQLINRDHPIIFAEVHPGREQALADVLTPWGYQRVNRFRSKFNPTPIEEWRFII